jgi:predicted nucleic acid-binding protein
MPVQAQGQAQVIVLDANILVSAIIGVQTKRVLEAAIERGVTLGIPAPQILESSRVLIDKLGVAVEKAQVGLEAVTAIVTPLGREFYGAKEDAARQRLHQRAQPDWPVLAAALTIDGGIWTHDRDFFGTGVPVWSSRNLRYAT